MTPDATSLRILYDPVGWADPQWLTLLEIDSRWPRRMSNALLMRRANIRPVTVEDLDVGGACWLLQNWDILPQVVYLVGARLVRNALMTGSALHQLRHHAAGFLALPLPELVWARSADIADANEWRLKTLHARILAAGTSCLHKSWPDMPQGWFDRVRVKLPPEAHQCGGDAKAQTLLPASASCQRLLNHAVVFQHAEKD